MAWNEEHRLYPYQQQAADYLTKNNALLAFDMGTGKTPTTLYAIEALREIHPNIVDGMGIVVAPASLKFQWAREITKFTDQQCIVVEGSKAQREAQFARADREQPGYLVMSYDSFVRDRAMFFTLGRAFLVIDECFPDDTPVDTPDGERRIQDIKVGDMVIGANGPSIVRRTISRLTANLARVTFSDGSTITCTPNHRFFTAVGWQEARMLSHGDEVIRINEAVRMVRGRGDTYQGPLLRDILLREMEDVPAGHQGEVPLQGGTSQEVGEEHRLAPILDIEGAVSEGVSGESRMVRRVGGEVPGNLDGQREHHQGSSRQRASSHSTGAVAVGQSGGGLEVELPRLTGSEEGRVSDALQGGPGTAGTSAGGGGGWELASVEEGAGREEGFSPGFLRVDCVEILKPGHPDFDQRCVVPDRVRVYNLEVQGHPSYSVNGLLVHNCTALKNYNSKRSKFFKEVSGQFDVRIALTGTPIENGRAEEIFSIMEWVDPTVLGKYWDFERKYIVRNPLGWIDRYKNLDHMHRRLKPALLRATHNQPEVSKYLPKVLYRDPVLVKMDRGTSRAVDRITSDLLSDLDSIAASVTHFGWENPDLRPDHPDGKMMAKIQVLRMLLDHPDAVRRSAEKFNDPESPDGSSYAAEIVAEGILDKVRRSPKMDALEQYVHDFLDEDPSHKAVVFCSFISVADDIEELFGARAVVFNGDMSAREKDAAKQKFASDPSCRVFVSTDAGGYGLDLPEANLLINYDLPWQAGLLKQRNARIRRASSDWEYVVVQDFIVEGTIEERMLETLLHKVAVSDAIVDGEGITDTGTVASSPSSLRTFLLSI